VETAENLSPKYRLPTRNPTLKSVA
jgi:hypothetical protein